MSISIHAAGLRRGVAVAFCAVFSLTTVSPVKADHVAGGFGPGVAGPIETVQAATLPKGKVALGISSSFVKSEGFSDDDLIDKAAHHVHAHDADYVLTTKAGLAYGVTDDLSLGLSLPFIHREDIRAGNHSHHGGTVSNTAERFGDSDGLGDISALGAYSVLKEDSAGLNGVLLFGLKMPTGQEDVRHDGEKLEVEHQPGSGSWDPSLGFAAGRKVGPVSVDASAVYTFVTKGSRETELGDTLKYGVAVSHRLGGAAHEHQDESVPHTHGGVDLVLELNGEWRGHDREDGEKDEDSGGHEIFLSPGIRYAPGETWSTYVSVGVPVVSNMNDGHADTAYKVTAGIGWAF